MALINSTTTANNNANNNARTCNVTESGKCEHDPGPDFHWDGLWCYRCPLTNCDGGCKKKEVIE